MAMPNTNDPLACGIPVWKPRSTIRPALTKVGREAGTRSETKSIENTKERCIRQRIDKNI